MDRENNQYVFRLDQRGNIIGIDKFAGDKDKPACPLCGKNNYMGKKAKPVYGIPICKLCYRDFATRRQVAFIIDLFLWQFCLAIPSIILGIGPVARAFSPEAWLLFLVFCFKDGFSGSSPGRIMMGLKVVDKTSGQPIGFGVSFIRNLPLMIPFMPLIIAFQLHKGNRIGDGWANTRVIWKKYKDKLPFAISDKDKIASSQYEQRQTEAKKEGPTLADRLMGRVSEGKELSERETEEVMQSEHELEEPLKSEAGEGLQEEVDRISQGFSAMIYDYTPGFLYGTLKAFEICDRGEEIQKEVRDCMGMESGDLLVDENRTKDFLRLVKKYGSDMANKLYIEIKSYFIFLISTLSEKALDKDDSRNLLSYLDKIAKEDAQRLQTEYKEHAYLKYTLTENHLEGFCRNICNILSKTSTVLTLDDVRKNVCNKDIELRMHLFLGFSLFFIHVLPVMTSGILEGELKYEMKRKKDKEALFFPKGVRASIVTGKAHLRASIDSYEYFPDDGYIHVDIRVINDGEINIDNYKISYTVFNHSKEHDGWVDGRDLEVGQSRTEYGIVYIGKGKKVHSVRVIDVEWEVD